MPRCERCETLKRELLRCAQQKDQVMAEVETLRIEKMRLLRELNKPPEQRL